MKHSIPLVNNHLVGAQRIQASARDNQGQRQVYPRITLVLELHRDRMPRMRLSAIATTSGVN